MKTIIFFALMISLTVDAQVITKKDIAPICLTFASGFFDGFNEALDHHYAEVDAKFGLNDKFWDPAISWTNKYKNGNPDEGPAYFGSTTCLAWTTDGYHLTRMMRNVTAMTTISIKIGERQKWYQYVIEAVMYYLTYTVGFTFSYDYIFRQTERR